MKHFSLVLGLLALLALAPAARAQALKLEGGTIGSGGGTSSGGIYSVTGTMGQPGSTTMSGGEFGLESGFWSLAIAVQMPDAPTLTITLFEDHIVLSWPTNTEVIFQLQANASLVKPNWLPVPQVPNIVGTEYTVTLPIVPGYQFYRLKWP